MSVKRELTVILVFPYHDQITLPIFTRILFFLSQCCRSPYGTYSSSRKIGSDLTQQPSMLTTFMWEPIVFMSSISSKSWSVASLSVESKNKITWKQCYIMAMFSAFGKYPLTSGLLQSCGSLIYSGERRMHITFHIRR